MLSWSSNKTKVATVDQNGVVTAHAAGTAKITVSAINTSGKTVLVASTFCVGLHTVIVAVAVAPYAALART